MSALRPSLAALLVACPLLAGCPPDLDGYRLVKGDLATGAGDGDTEEDAAVVEEDAAVVEGDAGVRRDGAAPVDATARRDGPVDLARPRDHASSGCTLPMLIVLVRSDSGSGVDHGVLKRYSLATSKWCPDLIVSKTLPRQGSAVGWLGPDLIILGAENYLYAVGPEDQCRWTVHDNSVGFPSHFTVVKSPAGEELVGAALGLWSHSPDVERVETYDRLGARKHKWTTSSSGDIRLGFSVKGAATNPFDAAGFLFLRDDSSWTLAKAAAPFAGTPTGPVTYVKSLPTNGPRMTVASLRGSPSRVAIVQQVYSSDFLVYQVSDSTGDGSAPQTAGPFTCAAHCYSPQVFWDAVPDPRDKDRVLATCQTDKGGHAGNIVRLGAGGCELFYEGQQPTALPLLSYPYRLALAMP